MTVKFIGTTFAANSQWHTDEHSLINRLQEQIQQCFKDQNNLFINTTWFGPQFDNGKYQEFLQATEHEKFDNLFLLAAADPVFLSKDQIDQIFNRSGAAQMFLCGHFDGQYQFNFHSQVLPKYFRDYAQADLKLTQADYVYLCYNRKPREHRVDLVKKLVAADLKQHGIVTLGKNDAVYSKHDQNDFYFLLDEEPEDFAGEGNWGLSMHMGIPHDIHSLGNMNLWQRHFLTVVSETEFLPWDNLFVSEKTWKPMLGLRPFVVNGQTPVYQWLRNNGFKTFNNYWAHVPIEAATELTIHDCIVNVIKYLSAQPPSELVAMWQEMLPDLEHNRNRFFEFSKEQQYKVNHLFQ